ncbi:MAG: Xaa-Pro peptidase family protein [Actinomycetota bacterium]|nr:Xaa-Pro peptidase family protein [Actinomycetota bacterium]
MTGPLSTRHADRLTRLREKMGESGVAVLWVEPSINFLYLTGLDPLSIERLSGLLVPAEGDLTLVVPAMLEEETRALGATNTFTWTDGEGPEGAAGKALAQVSKLWVQPTLPMWAGELLRRSSPGLEVEVEPGLIPALRRIKDDHEVELLRQSGEFTDEVVEWVGELDLERMTERKLARRIRARYLELGVEGADWALVASGPNASMPHYAGGDVAIETNRPLLLDFGGAVEGYWSDITRIYFPRDLDPEIKEAYEVVCAAAEAAFKTAAPGVACSEVDRAARSVIEDAGLGEYFVHRTGHGLGLDVHEDPYIREGNEVPLEVGNVFSIEPGVYVPGRYGVRYENIVHLSDRGPESFNHSPREHYFSN